MEKDSQFEMPAWKVHRSDLYADSKITRSAVISRVYGTSFKLIVNLS